MLMGGLLKNIKPTVVVGNLAKGIL